MVDYVNMHSHKVKWVLKKGNEYLSSIRCSNKEGKAAMTYALTSDKEEALQLCTKVAAISMLCAIENHLSTEFKVESV